MNNTLNFSISSLEFVDNVQDALFRKMRIKAFASGENAHTLPISEDVLRRGALTVYNKPIVWKYNPFTDDANTHDIDEVPCGFIPENDENKLTFEREPDGRLFMVVNALIWTKYCGRLLDIFKRDGYKKDVSIEIITNDKNKEFGDKPEVLDFVVAGITILGEWIDPACKGASAELLKFSIDDFDADKEKYLSLTQFAKNTITIDNSKESAIDGVWSNPRRKLFNPIINSDNKDSLLKEAYLVHGDNNEPIMSEYKYPHHVIKDGKLVLHIRGLQSAFSRASQQDIVSGEIKQHILKHYKELGLNQENFSSFNLSKEDFEYFANSDANNLESVGDKEMGADKNMECNDKENMAKVECQDDNDKMESNVDNQDMAEVEASCNTVNESEESQSTTMSDDESQIDKEDSQEMSLEEMSEKIQKLEEENKAYMAQIESMADYDELKKFKADVEEKEAREKEMAEMEKVMSEIEKRGVTMSNEDKETLKSDISKFSSIDAWSNYVKAYAFDKSENFGDVVRIANTDSNMQKSGSIWDNFNF